MIKRIGLILMFAAMAVSLWVALFIFEVDYWLSPPHTKMNVSWQKDTQLLEQSGKLPKEWNEIKDVRIRADNSPIQAWLQKISAPIKRNPNGKYRLEIFLIHWVEDYRYGAVVQYNLVDISSENTVWEAGRTFKLGIMY